MGGNNNIRGLNIALGVTGGIAAYKTADLASKLTGQGVNVRTLLTDSAEHFVGAKTFEALTGQPVFTTMWTGPEEYKSGHIGLMEWADMVVIAPATADIIAKSACGICNDILSTTLCACWQLPILIAPAMNSNMWSNPIVQKNTEYLISLGWHIVGPGQGRLACGTEGDGRMSEPEEIIQAIEQIAETIKSEK